MRVKFAKMHGIGNDYIYVNGFEQTLVNPEQLAIKWSDRHFGIGSDGLVLILPSDKADCRMRMFNADGSEGKMCGNAIRCVGKYVYDRGMVKKDHITVETLSGIKTLQMIIRGGVAEGARVDMGEPELSPARIPVLSQSERVINETITVDEKAYGITCVSMGNPHAVVFLKGIDALPLSTLGPLFEHHPMFPDRVNTEFVEVAGPTSLRMRVWERGSGETMACGTGACASAVAAILNGHCQKDNDISVSLKGGELVIRWAADNHVYMTGPATFVFEGEIDTDGEW